MVYTDRLVRRFREDIPAGLHQTRTRNDETKAEIQKRVEHSEQAATVILAICTFP